MDHKTTDKKVTDHKDVDKKSTDQKAANGKVADNMPKTPLSVIMDMAKNEIGAHAVNCMNANNIPPFLMVCILKEILSEFTQMKVEQLSEEFVNLQKSEEA